MSNNTILFGASVSEGFWGYFQGRISDIPKPIRIAALILADTSK
ncbi:MAG TPA: hypothetical protein VN645_05360 [Steroidobacteraceae bacterium]|nr:hypothetical protein [Steroidobacteraceae bacterium]